LYGRRQFRPYLEQQAVDVAIIDVAWNGILESAKIAAMAAISAPPKPSGQPARSTSAKNSFHAASSPRRVSTFARAT
jgi:L-alanine-DL-glutamate epimerase-like enolase superfamily enzyme